MTTGSAKGRVYPIAAVAGGGKELLCAGVNAPDSWKAQFHLGADGIVKGDKYRVIGSGLDLVDDYTYSPCWPQCFGRGSSGAFACDNQDKRVQVIRELDDDGTDPALFAYGVIISPPEQGSDGACRVDIFCFRGQYKWAYGVHQNQRPLAWHVSHVQVY
jgi:hypothetical protein